MRTEPERDVPKPLGILGFSALSPGPAVRQPAKSFPARPGPLLREPGFSDTKSPQPPPGRFVLSPCCPGSSRTCREEQQQQVLHLHEAHLHLAPSSPPTAHLTWETRCAESFLGQSRLFPWASCLSEGLGACHHRSPGSRPGSPQTAPRAARRWAERKRANTGAQSCLRRALVA